MRRAAGRGAAAGRAASLQRRAARGIPRITSALHASGRRLSEIPGSIASAFGAAGCAFTPRCGQATSLWRDPLPPCTRALFASVPGGGRRRPAPLAGDLPSPFAPPPGCRFHPRCPLADARCRAEAPALRTLAPGHQVACHHAQVAAALPAGLGPPAPRAARAADHAGPHGDNPRSRPGSGSCRASAAASPTGRRRRPAPPLPLSRSGERHTIGRHHGPKGGARRCVA